MTVTITREATVKHLICDYALLQTELTKMLEVEEQLLRAIALAGDVPIGITNQAGGLKDRHNWRQITRGWIRRNAHFFSDAWRNDG